MRPFYLGPSAINVSLERICIGLPAGEQATNNMILISPKHFNACVTTLQEEVQKLGRFKRVRMMPKRLSPVAGTVNDDGSFSLESNNDPFSKRLTGVLIEDGNRTIIEAKWFVPFWSKIYGHHEDNEDVILSFLKKWLLVMSISEPGVTH